MDKLPSDAKEAYEVISHTTKTASNGVIGYIWWTGKTTKTSIKSLETSLKGISIAGSRITDGYQFFQNLPLHIRGGYVSLKKVK
jgi:hypothetical protein